MHFSNGHSASTCAEKNALMSEVFAMQCSSESGRALISEVFAQQSTILDSHVYSYRYC